LDSSIDFVHYLITPSINNHNAVLTAQIAEKVGAAFVAVATVEEGI